MFFRSVYLYNNKQISKCKTVELGDQLVLTGVEKITKLDLITSYQVLKSDHAEQVDYEYNNLSSLLEAAAACEDDLAAVIVGAFDYRYSR